MIRRTSSPRPIPTGMPRAVADLAQRFQRLPGVGEKTAHRFALAVASGDPELGRGLAEALASMPARLFLCPRCGAVADRSDAPPLVCAICRDTRRDPALLCVVARHADLMAIESTGAMRGRYPVAT